MAKEKQKRKVERTRENPGKGLYLYAVVNGGREYRFPGLGIGSETAYSLLKDGVSAIVSDIPNKAIRPVRRNMGAHRDVLKALFKKTTPLPAKFGLIADSRKMILGMIENNLESFQAELRRVDGMAEMVVTMELIGSVFRYLVDSFPELEALRDRVYKKGRGEPDQEDKIELGSVYNRLIGEVRETVADTIEERLKPICKEIKRNGGRRDEELVNLACLVTREAVPRFDETINEVATSFDEKFLIKSRGPWAPHNFVEIEEINLKAPVAGAGR